MFAYIAGATFVLQRIHGMSAQGFSLVFGLNSVGIMVMSQVGARLSRRRPPAQVLANPAHPRTRNFLGAVLNH